MLSLPVLNNLRELYNYRIVSLVDCAVYHHKNINLITYLTIKIIYVNYNVYYYRIS